MASLGDELPSHYGLQVFSSKCAWRVCQWTHQRGSAQAKPSHNGTKGLTLSTGPGQLVTLLMVFVTVFLTVFAFAPGGQDSVVLKVVLTLACSCAALGKHGGECVVLHARATQEAVKPNFIQCCAGS